MNEKDKDDLVKAAELAFKKAENAWCEARVAMDEAEQLLGKIQEINTGGVVTDVKITDNLELQVTKS